ncbi:hypothetical protein [Streptomyces griseus]|uniref:hypothetical protein n=1 Tax=Streptomyces griseus TaxID=1911 RepID=UPI0033D295A2
MAIGDPYVSLAEFKEYLNVPVGKISLDLSAATAIESASREVERHCNRQFNKQTSATPRLYRPGTRSTVAVDDFWTDEGLVVEVASGGGDWVALAASDFELAPENGVVDGQPGWPYCKIVCVSATGFPGYRRLGSLLSVRVTAKWGWTAVPGPVRSACEIIASETFNMKDAPFGVAGMDQWGPVRVRDNRIAASKLSRYTRNKLLVG